MPTIPPKSQIPLEEMDATLFQLLYHQQEEGFHLLPPCYSPANQKHSTWDFWFIPMAFLLSNSPFTSVIFHCKRVFLSFVLWTCLWFCVACMSWLAILFFPDKVVFAGKPTILFLRLTVPFVTPMFLLIQFRSQLSCILGLQFTCSFIKNKMLNNCL